MNTSILVVECDMIEQPNIVPGTVIERVTLFKRQGCYSKYRCRYRFFISHPLNSRAKDHEVVLVKILCLRVLVAEEKKESTWNAAAGSWK